MDGEIDPDELADLVGVGRGDDDDGRDDAGRGDDGDDTGRDDAGSRNDTSGRGVRIVDIRDRRAFDRGHLPGSESIPFPELTTRIAELEGEERIVTVCPHGIASKQAAQLIGSYEGTTDARVESLRGGIEAWERDVGALERTDGSTEHDGEGAEEGPDAPF